MRNRAILLIILLAVSTCQSATVSYKQACKDIRYWNQYFATETDSIHKQAARHYAATGIFAPQTEFESSSRYVQRIMSSYQQVKEHEFDILLPTLKRMFEVYAQEISMNPASFTLGTYDADEELLPMEITILDTLKIQVQPRLAPTEARKFKENRKKYTIKVYGAYGVLDQPSPYRYTIAGPNQETIVDEKFPVFESIFTNSEAAYIVPRKNRQEFWLESYANQEKIINPVLKTVVTSDDHLYVKGASSGLMSNRVAGRSGYNRETFQYNLLKYDFTVSGKPQKYMACQDESDRTVKPKFTGLSPEGRIIIQEHADSTNLYDFSSGKNLGMVLKYNNKNIGGKSYIFDQYDFRIYVIGYEDQYYYDIVKKVTVPFDWSVRLSKVNNTNTRAALWLNEGNSLQLLNIKTKDIEPYFLTDEKNSDRSLHIRAVDFSPDERMMAVLAITSDYNLSYLFIFDVLNKKLLRKIEMNSGWGIAFSREGQNILCTDDRSGTIFVIHLGIQLSELAK